MSEIKFPPVPEWIGRVAHDRTGQGPRIWADADVLDYARAAVALNAPGWLPIETAPKDGTLILLGRPKDEDRYQDEISIPGRWQEGWEDSVDDMGCDSGFVDVDYQIFHGGRSFGVESSRYAANQPTHWQPLPAGPGAA